MTKEKGASLARGQQVGGHWVRVWAGNIPMSSEKLEQKGKISLRLLTNKAPSRDREGAMDTQLGIAPLLRHGRGSELKPVSR
jgi:hypothetical protein